MSICNRDILLLILEWQLKQASNVLSISFPSEESVTKWNTQTTCEWVWSGFFFSTDSTNHEHETGAGAVG